MIERHRGSVTCSERTFSVLAAIAASLLSLKGLALRRYKAVIAAASPVIKIAFANEN